MRFRYYVDFMTEKVLTAKDFESRAKEVGLSIAELCRRAKVAQSSFHRWKTGDYGISIGTYSNLLDVLLAAESHTESESAAE